MSGGGEADKGDGDNQCHLCGDELPEIIYKPQSTLNRNSPCALNRWCLPLYEGEHVTDRMANDGHEYCLFTVCKQCHDAALEADDVAEAKREH